jgi:hypothetical protein
MSSAAWSSKLPANTESCARSRYPAGVGSPSAEHRSVISGTIRRRRSVATGMVTVVDVRPATQYSNDVRIYRYIVQYCKRNETSGVLRGAGMGGAGAQRHPDEVLSGDQTSRRNHMAVALADWIRDAD